MYTAINCDLEIPGEGALMMPSSGTILKNFDFTNKNTDIMQTKPPQDQTKYKCNY